MSEYLKLSLEDGSELYIEAIETRKRLHGDMEKKGEGYDYYDVPAMSAENSEEKVVETGVLFEKVMPAVTGFVNRISEQIRRDIASDELEMEFSVALNTELKAVICSGGTKADFKVKMKWRKD